MYVIIRRAYKHRRLSRRAVGGYADRHSYLTAGRASGFSNRYIEFSALSNIIMRFVGLMAAARWEGGSMSTAPRRISLSGIYHITQRGAGRAIIYEDSADRMAYLDLLAKVKERYGFELYAYCLMGNHSHLLLRFRDNSSASALRDLGSGYALYFNDRHGRVGHLFESRYRSQAVDNRAYALCAVRYILQNPMRCGLCAPQDYPWSSYSEYARANTLPQGRNVRSLTDTGAMLGELSSAQGFCEFVNTVVESDSQRFASWRKLGALDDAEASEAVAALLGIASSLEVGSYELERRNDAIRRLESLDIPPTQLARVIGVNRTAIYRAFAA